MTKLKKKRLSETLIKKSASKSKTNNPFEVHINRQKFDVLGKKSKNDRGLPGVARSKSIKKRKETLLQEYKVKDKANKFLDRRIGETNSAMTSEDKVMARYTAERMKAHNKKTMFNLADDEVLTHRGQSLSEIERFDDPRSDDDDEDDDLMKRKGGGLEAAFVGEAHFGGGMLRDSAAEKSRATLIDELIAESKRRRAEKARAKEQTLELTERLDADWQELLPLVNAGQKEKAGDEEERPEKQSYDHLMRQLRFESRGKPTDKLRSEEDIAREEKMKLEQLEAERIKRMQPNDASTSTSTKIKHQSADDLDDGLDLQSEAEEMSDKEEETSEAGKIADESEDEEEEEEEEDENEEEEEDNDEDGANEDDVENKVEADVSGKDESKEEGEEVEEEEEEEDEEYEYEKVDRDELVEEEDEEEEEGEEDVQRTVETSKNKEPSAVTSSKTNTSEQSAPVENAIEPPLTPKMPESYEDFQMLVNDFGAKDQAVIVERLIKLYHPSLGDNNRQKLENLFTFLLQHLNDAEYQDCWKVLSHLSPHLYDLTQFSPQNSANCLMEVIIEKHTDYQQQKFRFPETETLLFLKLVPLLFPSSDVRHPVATPAIVFLCQMLNQCRISGRRDIAYGLFVVTILLEYTSLSKRFCPEVTSFLIGIIQMSVAGAKVALPTCKSDYRPLLLKTPADNANSPSAIRLSCSDLSVDAQAQIDDQFRIAATGVALRLLHTATDQYASLPAAKVIFAPLNQLIAKFKISKYPKSVADILDQLKTSLDKICNKKMDYIVSEAKRPKALKLYEPLIEKIVDGKKKYGLSEEQAEHQKLVAKLRQETKGALREIRRDRQFLSKIKFHEQAKSDAERKRKVRQIYGWGAEQQGELNKIKRKKK
ncbi:nucleolar protein 14 homolog isoform X3 [Nilaparvata lugens]|uniref:nucleolar protein 14 homolog isoform X3 n=1 Tax=Nilaparvata lugens TaxID=108931 RepID=UPI00193C9C22|nr:nucleolar protein 14 homolog isoform X3 [Nilaparvata lugens]